MRNEINSYRISLGKHIGERTLWRTKRNPADDRTRILGKQAARLYINYQLDELIIIYS